MGPVSDQRFSAIFLASRSRLGGARRKGTGGEGGTAREGYFGSRLQPGVQLKAFAWGALVGLEVCGRAKNICSGYKTGR